MKHLLRSLIALLALVSAVSAVPLSGNTITADGTYTVTTYPGKRYVFSAAGTFGGGSLAVNWTDSAGTSTAFANSPATSAETWTFTAPTGTVSLVLSGSTNPSITVGIIPAGQADMDISELTQSGALAGQAPIWNGTAFAPATVNTTSIDQSKPSDTAVNSWLTRDKFAGTPGVYALGATVTSDISGTLTTYSNVTTASYQKVPGAFLMTTPSGWCGLKTSNTVTHTAGRTGIALIKLHNATSDEVRVGWGSSSYLSGGYDMCTSGVLIGDTGGNVKRAARVLSLTNNLSGIGFRGFNDGDVIGVAISLTASGFDVWINGGPVTTWGVPAGGAAWVKVYSDTSGTIAGNLSFMVEARTGPATVLEMGTTDTFNPDERGAGLIEQDNSYYLTHCATAYYDSSGNLWATWTQGNTGDALADGKVIVRCRLANGKWSDKVVVAGPGSGNVCYDAGTFWQSSDGTVHVVYNSTTDMWSTAVLKTKVLSVDSSAVITQGSASSLAGYSIPYILTYQPVIRITSGAYTGRLVMPCNSAHQWTTLYSDNEGATWNIGTWYYGINTGTSNGYEPCIVEEGPEKTLAAYIRTSYGTSNTMPRWVSTDGGATWSMSGTIPVPSCDSRAQAVRLPNGDVAVIANNSTTNFVRPDPSIWWITRGNVLIGKTTLTNGWTDNWNYPAIAAYKDRVSVVMPIKSNAMGQPGRVYFAEQTIAAWAANGNLRNSGSSPLGRASAGLNSDIVRLSGFTLADGNASKSVIYTETLGNGYGYGFDNSGIRIFGYGTSWAIDGTGAWTAASSPVVKAKLISPSAPPASATATGTTGTIAWDANYIYICTATNTWKRVAIASW